MRISAICSVFVSIIPHPQSLIPPSLRLPHNQFIIRRGDDGFDRAFVRNAFDGLFVLEQFDVEMHRLVGFSGEAAEGDGQLEKLVGRGLGVRARPSPRRDATAALPALSGWDARRATRSPRAGGTPRRIASHVGQLLAERPAARVEPQQQPLGVEAEVEVGDVSLRDHAHRPARAAAHVMPGVDPLEVASPPVHFDAQQAGRLGVALRVAAALADRARASSVGGCSPSTW